MNFSDQLNRSIFIPSPPKRIISLVPSQTELLVDLGLEDNIVGVTKFCIHPKRLRQNKTIIGGTKNYRFEIIDDLKPDLIIGNKEENDQEGIERLMKKYPVWISDISSVKDSLEMIRSLGEIFQVDKKATIIIDQVKVDFSSKPKLKGTAVYLIWNNPTMAAGSMTFIDEMLTYAGFQNAIKSTRYPEITIEELQELAPDYLLLSTEPFPFTEKHILEFGSLLPLTKILLVEGELFSWYGSRLLKSKAYFETLH
jgi:ABC-type Fe3+-hydroxamate transport system substrate-binding protein